MVNLFAFPWSSFEAFFRIYGIQHGEPNSSLDHQVEFKNMLCMLSPRTVKYDKEEHTFQKRNKTSYLYLYIF